MSRRARLVVLLLIWLPGGVARAPAQEREPMYLPPSQTGGSAYLFDPASPRLRRAVARPFPRPDDLIDARLLANDLEFLRQALRKEYVGYPELLQQPDFDVEDLFDRHIARLRAGPGEVSFAEGALTLLAALKRRIRDRHFGLLGAQEDPGLLYREYQATLSGRPPRLEGCTAEGIAPSTLRMAPLARAGRTASWLLTVSAHPRGDTLTLACGTDRHELRLRPRSVREPRQHELPAYEWRRWKGSAVMRIRRLKGPPAEQEKLRRMTEDYAQHRRATSLVFDLRGNEGGNDSFVSRWIDQARSGSWNIGHAEVFPAGSHLPWLIWNHLVWNDIAFGRIDDPAAIAEREKQRADWPKPGLPPALRFETGTVESHSRRPYPGRTFVLMDAACGSSGESSAWMLRQALGAILVGERSAGYLEYGNQRKLVLPATQLVWSFSTKRNHYSQPVEAVGLPPDYYLAPEDMAAPVEQLLPALLALPSKPPGSPRS
jgi:hypothetical protein